MGEATVRCKGDGRDRECRGLGRRAVGRCVVDDEHLDVLDVDQSLDARANPAAAVVRHHDHVDLGRARGCHLLARSCLRHQLLRDPVPSVIRSLVLIGIVVAGLAPGLQEDAAAGGGTTFAREPRAVEVGESIASKVGPALMRDLRAAGITEVIVDRTGLTRRQRARVRRLAAAVGLPVVEPAIWARTLAAGVSLAARRPSGLVAVRVEGPEELLSVAPDRYQGRVRALVPLSEPSISRSGFLDALRASASNDYLGFGVTPSGAYWRESLDTYLELLASAQTVRDAPARIFVAPDGSDGGPCTREAPCASLGHAYRVAQPGDVVEMAGGSYPSQLIAADPAKSATDDVLIRPALGAQVTIAGSLIVEASHIELRSIRAGYWKSRLATDQVFRDLDVALFFIHGSQQVTVSGGDVGPNENSDSQIASLKGRVPTDILIENVLFHDTIKTDPEAHTECLQIGAGIRVTIRANRFVRCADHDILIRSWAFVNDSPHPLQDFVIENNFFGATLRGYYSLRLAEQTGWPCERFVVRNNSALQNMYSDCEARDVRFIANLQPSNTRRACAGGAGTVWDYNVYSEGEPCGPNDIIAPLGYVDPDSLDLHLIPGSAALGHAPPDGGADTDIDGQQRPRGDLPDAGADERR